LTLQYWPALLYESYGELVRDLSKATSPRIKAKFSLKHRKYGNAVVARLLGWDDALKASSGGEQPTLALPPPAAAGNNLTVSGGGESIFPEKELQFVELNSTLDELDSENSTRVLSFYDAQCDLEECCTALLRRYSSSKGKGSEEQRAVYNYAIQFQKAVDMALNCLALDVGADILPPREEGEGVVEETLGVAAAAASTDVAKNNVEVTVKKNEGVENKKDGETKVQNLEVAVHPTATKNGATNVATTKSKSVQPKEMKQQKVIMSKKVAESKRGGGGGTKSRPEASQHIPKKFQSASKTTNSTTTTTTTTQQSPLPWKQVWKIMKSKGWTWKGPVGLMTGYRYIKPGCKIKSGQQDIDYFNSEEAVQRFARNVYGWGTRHNTIEALEEIIGEHAKYAGEVVPPLHPLTTIGPNEPWRDVWDKMRQSGGWTWKAGSGLMMDYYYIKPNCSIKGGLKGEDYFERVEDVQKFAKRNYGWVGEVVEGEVVVGGSNEEHRRAALEDLNENKLPEKRRRTEKISIDKPVAKKMKTLKSKADEKMKSIKEEEVMKEEEEEEFEEEMASSDNDANDDDNISRFSEARSTYSQSGFQSKKLFVNECADENVPSLEGEQIHPDDAWSDVWKTMRKAGWAWKVGTGLMTDYYYIKPGCNVRDGEEGKEYFVSVEDVKSFAERNYGWNRRVTAEDLDSRGRGRNQSLSTSSDESHFSEAKSAAAAEIKSKKTVKKSRTSPQQEQKKHASSTPIRPDPYNWKTLWPALQKDGWRVVKAGKYNRLHDWYYVRPDCDPGDGSSELHIDYFLSEEDVCGFARQINYFDDGYEESEPAYEEYVEPAQIHQAKQPPKRVKTSSKHPSTPEGCETQPQDPAKPLLSSAESCSSQSSSSSNDYYDWNNLWPVLQTGGWRVVKASNPLHDWYYIRPNRDPRDSRTKLGRHYFTCPDDVIDFVKTLDEKDGAGKPSRKSDIGGMLKAFEDEATVYSGSQL